MNFTTPYTHNISRSKDFATINTEESMTQQDDKNDADINVIVGRFMKTGQLPNVNAQAIAGDFTNGADFRAMQDQLLIAREAFQQLPAEVKTRFNQDPAQFIEFATNKENLAELRKMGLANPIDPVILNTTTPTGDGALKETL